jgi:hypothetical protein
MLRPAHRKAASLNWSKYERKVSVRLRSGKNKKSKPEPRRPKNKIFLGVAVLLFLVVLILIGKLFGFLGSINEPYSKDSQKFNSWNGESPLNLVVKADDLYLLSYQPKSKSLTILKFPGGIYIDTPYDFGKWPVGSIYDLGQAEKPPMGVKLLKDSLGDAFNLVPDGYIILGESSPGFLEVVDNERKDLIPGIDLLSKSKTDLNILEYLKVWWTIKNVRSDKLKIINLEKSDLTEWLFLPDGSRVITLDPIKMSQFEEGRFEDINIKDEVLSIGIMNATDFPGLAEKAAKIITNLGGRVIFTTNAPEKSGKSMILAKKSYSSEYLSDLLRLSCPVPKNANLLQKIPFFGLNKPDFCALEDNNFDISRADIIIILGEDSFLKYKK